MDSSNGHSQLDLQTNSITLYQFTLLFLAVGFQSFFSRFLLELVKLLSLPSFAVAACKSPWQAAGSVGVLLSVRFGRCSS